MAWKWLVLKTFGFIYWMLNWLLLSIYKNLATYWVILGPPRLLDKLIGMKYLVVHKITWRSINTHKLAITCQMHPGLTIFFELNPKLSNWYGKYEKFLKSIRCAVNLRVFFLVYKNRKIQNTERKFNLDINLTTALKGIRKGEEGNRGEFRVLDTKLFVFLV